MQARSKEILQLDKWKFVDEQNNLEATGLKNCGSLRITELSFVAVNTENILDLSKMLISHLQIKRNKVETLFPRVMIGYEHHWLRKKETYMISHCWNQS